MTTDAFQEIFAQARRLFLPFSAQCVVIDDDPSRYYLATHEVRARDGYRTGFGGVEIRKFYISVHVMPVYVHPDLLLGIGDRLRKRMQGKSCFNFKTLDRELLNELGRLIDCGAARFERDGRLPPRPA